MTLLVWLLVAAGLALVYRCARTVADRQAAALASVALGLGQFAVFPPGAREAVLFALAALALERSLALHANRPRVALALAAAPALLTAVLHPGLPSPGQFVDVLFCSQHGLLATSAVCWIGAAGIAWPSRGDDTRRPWWIAPAALLVVLALAGGQRAGATWADSHAAAGAVLPFVGVGLALLVIRLRAIALCRPAWAATALVLPLVVWNLSLVAVAHAGTLRIGEAVSFARIGAAQARTLHEWIGHPLSWPANLAFSLWRREAVWRFDELGVSHVDAQHPLAIDVGVTDDAFLADGWHAAERGGDISFRWARAQAVVLLPRLPSTRARIRLRLQPFAAPGTVSQTVRIQIGEKIVGPVTLETGWTWIEFDVDAPVLTRSAARMTLLFDHAARPSSAGTNRDDRDLAAAVDVIEIAIR